MKNLNNSTIKLLILFAIIFAGSLLTSCNKEQEQPAPTLIGLWDLTEIEADGIFYAGLSDGIVDLAFYDDGLLQKGATFKDWSLIDDEMIYIDSVIHYFALADSTLELISEEFPNQIHIYDKMPQ